MSDTMLLGVLRMPYGMAMGNKLSQLQYHSRGQEAADRIEQLERELALMVKTQEANLQSLADTERELAEESQRQIGCRPGAKPVNSAAISKQPVDTARGKARELLLAALRTGRALSTRQLTIAIASEISIVRDALEVMKSAGAIIKIEQRPALYRIAQ